MLLAAIKQREVDERIELTDADVLAVIDKMIKQRKDSIAQFEAGHREDLAAGERAEIAVLTAYMPAQLSRGRDRRDDRAKRSPPPAPPGIAGMGKVMARPQAEARRPRRHGRRLGQGQGEARRL